MGQVFIVHSVSSIDFFYFVPIWLGCTFQVIYPLNLRCWVCCHKHVILDSLEILLTSVWFVVRTYPFFPDFSIFFLSLVHYIQLLLIISYSQILTLFLFSFICLLFCRFLLIVFFPCFFVFNFLICWGGSLGKVLNLYANRII